MKQILFQFDKKEREISSFPKLFYNYTLSRAQYGAQTFMVRDFLNVGKVTKMFGKNC